MLLVPAYPRLYTSYAIMSLRGNEAAGLWMPGLVACLAGCFDEVHWTIAIALKQGLQIRCAFQGHKCVSAASQLFRCLQPVFSNFSGSRTVFKPFWARQGADSGNGFEQSTNLSTRLPTTTRPCTTTRLPTTTRPLCTSAEGRAFAQKVVSERMGRFREMNADDHKQGRRRLGRSLSGNNWSKSEAPA